MSEKDWPEEIWLLIDESGPPPFIGWKTGPSPDPEQRSMRYIPTPEQQDWPGEDAVEALAAHLFEKAEADDPEAPSWQELIVEDNQEECYGAWRRKATEALQALQPYLPGAQEAAERKELAVQAFVAGAEWVGSELDAPERQFERYWEEQLGHAADAEGKP